MQVSTWLKFEFEHCFSFATNLNADFGFNQLRILSFGATLQHSWSVLDVLRIIGQWHLFERGWTI